MPMLLLPIEQSSVSSDAWTGSVRVSSFVRSHVFCLLSHGVETNTRGTVSVNSWEPNWTLILPDWRIPFLFTLGGLLVIAFGIWQWRYDKYALIPLSILKNRTVLACSGAIFFFMLAMLGGTYQLPLFYQAVGRPAFM